MIAIRPATEADVAALVAVEARSNPSPWTAAAFSEELARAVSRVLVAELDGRVAGFVVFWVVADEAEILDIATDPDMRRRGVGVALVEAAVQASRDAGAAAMHLDVRAGNEPALALYRRVGFAIEGRRDAYYRDGETAVLMAMDLARPYA